MTKPRTNDISYGDVAPIFGMHCNPCHGPGNDHDWWPGPETGLNTRSYADLMTTGKDGPVIIPGSPGKSILYSRIADPDKDNRMPFLSAPLSGEVIDLIRAWIEGGAVDGPEAAPLIMRVSMHRRIAPPPALDSRIRYDDPCLLEDPRRRATVSRSEPPAPSRECESILARVRQQEDLHVRWLKDNTLTISCKIDTEAYVVLDVEGVEREPMNRVATFKKQPEYGDASVYRDWFTWEEYPSAATGIDLAVQLTVKYWEPGHSAIFLVSLGDMPADARKISFRPDPVHQQDKGILSIWLKSPSDVTVRIRKIGTRVRPREATYRNLQAQYRNDIEIPLGTVSGGSMPGRYIISIEVKPHGNRLGAYSGAIAVWAN